MSLPATRIITGTQGLPRIHSDSREKLQRRERQQDIQMEQERERQAKRLMLAQQLRDMRKSESWAPFVAELLARKEQLLSRLSSSSFKDMADLARAQGQASEIEWVLNRLKEQEQRIDELRRVETSKNGKE